MTDGWQEHTGNIAQVAAGFARSHDGNPEVLATRSGNPARIKQLASEERWVEKELLPGQGRLALRPFQKDWRR